MPLMDVKKGKGKERHATDELPAELFELPRAWRITEESWGLKRGERENMARAKSLPPGKVRDDLIHRSMIVRTMFKDLMVEIDTHLVNAGTAEQPQWVTRSRWVPNAVRSNAPTDATEIKDGTPQDFLRLVDKHWDEIIDKLKFLDFRALKGSKVRNMTVEEKADEVRNSPDYLAGLEWSTNKLEELHRKYPRAGVEPAKSLPPETLSEREKVERAAADAAAEAEAAATAIDIDTLDADKVRALNFKEVSAVAKALGIKFTGAFPSRSVVADAVITRLTPIWDQAKQDAEDKAAAA